MLYDISLRIDYRYSSPAAGGRQLLRLMPGDIPGQQRVLLSSLDIDPRPAERLDRLDFFGNHATEFAFRNPHEAVSVTMQARVERLRREPSFLPPAALDALPGQIAASRDLGPDSPLHFIDASDRVPRDPAIADYARAQVRPGANAAEAMRAVGEALHRDMRFDPEATEVDTPAGEAFRNRHGVCQDFTHIMISALRSLGIPAGYVSGYLRTLPPPGQARLEGADAMHAWVRAWCGSGAGWMEYDPTNAVEPDLDHVTAAVGRDYFDVAPVKGVLRGAGSQESRQAVDVKPAA